MKLKLTSGVCCFLLLFGCSKLTEDELWQRVEQSRDRSNFDSTILMCQTILKEYPNGQKASAAMYLLGETYQNGKHDYYAAVNYYQAFVRKYPDLNSTPVAMFVIGFIYNNNLQMGDSAKIAYQEFIARYPNHELAPSAKFELANIGRSPDDIIGPDNNVAAKAGKSKLKKKK